MNDTLYLFAVMFIKISIFNLYLRLLRVKRLLRYLNCTLMALVTVYCTSLLLDILLGCQPIARTWNSSILGRCVKLVAIDLTIGGFNILTETAILLLHNLLSGSCKLSELGSLACLQSFLRESCKMSWILLRALANRKTQRRRGNSSSINWENS